MMKQNFLSLASLACAFSLLTACNSGSDKGSAATGDSTSTTTTSTGEAGASDTKGIGKFKNVELTHPLDEKMVTAGQNVYNVKCASCHKTTDEKLVGPGWKGVTDRRTPEWIMNFVTNTEEMIDKDTAAQKMLEQCLVRMPNQSLNDQDARDVLEFMRKNDGKN
jgi:mono/diheme cytochrome c family protein